MPRKQYNNEQTPQLIGAKKIKSVGGEDQGFGIVTN